MPIDDDLLRRLCERGDITKEDLKLLEEPAFAAKLEAALKRAHCARDINEQRKAIGEALKVARKLRAFL